MILRSTVLGFGCPKNRPKRCGRREVNDPSDLLVVVVWWLLIFTQLKHAIHEGAAFPSTATHVTRIPHINQKNGGFIDVTFRKERETHVAHCFHTQFS